ncbi:MAG TPA: hypothetical protein VJ930_01015 [Acidimicrobiia bacterium]|nr:hypothetical protein [Acidimicrobiia bacterium]
MSYLRVVVMSRNRPFEDLRSLGEFLRNRVADDDSRRVAAAAVGRRRPQRSRAFVAIVAGTALFALANVALAQASDPAVPGQILYPLDRAYEWLSDRFVPHDRVPERVAEALELADGGQTDRALLVVTEILGDDESLQAEVGGLSGSGSSPAVRDEVKDLVGAASSVREAAQSGDADALADAIDNVKEEAQDVAETASRGNAAGDGDGENPGVTAPGQTNSPAATAPGRDPGASSSQGSGRGQGNSKP